MSPLVRLLLVVAVAVAVSGSANGLFEIVVVDGTAALALATPNPGASVVAYSATDPLSFSNGVSLERALWIETIAVAFTYDENGTTTAGPVLHLGTSTALTDVVFGAPSSVSEYTPFRLTGWDLTGQGGFTKNAGCGTVLYEGSLTIPRFSNVGVALANLLSYYQVCDGGEEIYVGPTKDLTTADFAYVATKATLVTTTEADYEVVLAGNDYAFAEAPSAVGVRLDQGRYVPIAGTTVDVHLLTRYPDGFPAGVLATTVTASALDITL